MNRFRVFEMRVFTIRSLLVLCSLLLGTATSTAAEEDGPRTFGGFYVGGHVGGGFGETAPTFSVPPPPQKHSISGVLGGVQLGHNWMLEGFVAGLEADFSGADIDGRDASAAGCGTATPCRTTINWFGTARARIGVPVDDILLFVTGGLAYGQSHIRSPTFYNDKEVNVGFAVGAGAELFALNNWSFKIEYLYVDLGKHGPHSFPPAAVNVTNELEFHVVRGGVNFLF